jgi:hypothetical protein
MVDLSIRARLLLHDAPSPIGNGLPISAEEWTAVSNKIDVPNC